MTHGNGEKLYKPTHQSWADSHLQLHSVKNGAPKSRFVMQCLVCFSRETYNALTNWLTDARTLASPNIVIVLVGNKKDLEAEREVTFLEASRFAIENGEFKRRASGHSPV